MIAIWWVAYITLTKGHINVCKRHHIYNPQTICKFNWVHFFDKAIMPDSIIFQKLTQLTKFCKTTSMNTIGCCIIYFIFFGVSELLYSLNILMHLQVTSLAHIKPLPDSHWYPSELESNLENIYTLHQIIWTVKWHDLILISIWMHSSLTNKKNIWKYFEDK